MNQESYSISVIIPVYGDGDMRSCLESITGQFNANHQGEILVVDNNQPADQRLEDVCSGFSQVRYIHERKPGSYSARNRGLTEAKGDVVAFTDADCIPQSGWLESGCVGMSDGAGLAAGRVSLVTPDGHRDNSVEAYEKIFAFQQRYSVERHGYGVTANLFCLRKVFEQVGPFDESLYSGGDIEWCTRAVRAGYSIVYCDDAVVSHPPRASLMALMRKGRRLAGGQVQLRNTIPVLADHFTLVGMAKSLLPPLRQFKTLFSHRMGLAAKLQIASVATINKYTISYWRLLYFLGWGGDLRRQ